MAAAAADTPPTALRRARRTASADRGQPHRHGGDGRAHGVDAHQRDRAGQGTVADREVCHLLARALSAPPGRRGPGVIARHEALCPPGGDRAAAGRCMSASPAEGPPGLLPTDERPLGHTEGEHRHRAPARPRD